MTAYEVSGVVPDRLEPPSVFEYDTIEEAEGVAADLIEGGWHDVHVYKTSEALEPVFTHVEFGARYADSGRIEGPFKSEAKRDAFLKDLGHLGWVPVERHITDWTTA